MEVSINDLGAQLPYTVRDKLRYYLDYINDRLIDITLEEGVYDRLAEVRDQVELVFFLRLLYGYFVIGFRNYERMLNYLDAKEVNGFQIGSTTFTRQSNITRDWQEIARELDHLVNQTSIGLFVKPGMSVETVIRRLVRSRSDSAEDSSSYE
jgi:hypothetical protein